MKIPVVDDISFLKTCHNRIRYCSPFFVSLTSIHGQIYVIMFDPFFHVEFSSSSSYFPSSSSSNFSSPPLSLRPRPHTTPSIHSQVWNKTLSLCWTPFFLSRCVFYSFNSSLAILALANNQIGVAGASYFAEALRYAMIQCHFLTFRSGLGFFIIQNSEPPFT